MNIPLVVIVFIFGLIIGSFLNVCIYRLPKSKSIVFPRSFCPACEKTILWFDNIPVLSYLILGAKCRFCKAKISWRYPVVELITASILAVIFGSFGLCVKSFAYSFMSCLLIVGTFTDFEILEIPDEITLGGLAAGLAIAILFPSIFDAQSRLLSLGRSACGAIAGGLSIYLMGFFGTLAFKREAMGGGDVKLMAMIGSFIGWKLALLTFFLAPFFGAVYGIVLLVKKKTDILPYGPFLAIAAVVSLIYGDKILYHIFFRWF